MRSWSGRTLTCAPDRNGRSPSAPPDRLPVRTWIETPATDLSGRLRWPLPALAGWALSWLSYRALLAADVAAPLSAAAGLLAGIALSRLAATRLRAWVIALGFPLSLLAASLPPWLWLLSLAALLLLYPRKAWRDAPLFPTPRRALDGLPAVAALPDRARVLDAGCGLGHGLHALRRAYPHARLEGIEWSWPLALAARAACRFAGIRRGDLWARCWAGFDMVYLFQRPESMPRVMAKALAEMSPGAWLVSLEFEAEGWEPVSALPAAGGRTLWIYRLPPRAAPQHPGASSRRHPGR
jgi:SAM-dependent methyltransferase